MNVSLSPELEAFVNAKVESGMYCSASEVIRDALRFLKERDDMNQQRLNELRREIQIGLDQLDRGEGVAFDEIQRELIKARGRARLAQQQPGDKKIA